MPIITSRCRATSPGPRSPIGALAAALGLAACAVTSSAYTASVEGSGEPVAVQNLRDAKNGSHLVMTMADGRAYRGAIPASGLPRPDEPEVPASLSVRMDGVEIPTGGHHRVFRTLVSGVLESFICEHRHEGPPMHGTRNGIGRCVTPRGEVIAIRC